MSSYPPPPAYQPADNQPEQSQSGGEPPIWAPWYGIGFVAAIKRFFKKYVDFSGRASRGEFWWFYLAYGIVIGVLLAIYFAVFVGSLSSQVAQRSADGTLNTDNADLTFPVGAVVPLLLASLIGLACLIPFLAIVWRRLHDANYPGPYYFLGLIPFAGPIILIVLLATGSRPEGARFDQPR